MGRQEAQMARNLALYLYSDIKLDVSGNVPPPLAGISDIQRYLFTQVMDARDATNTGTLSETLMELSYRLNEGGPRADHLKRIGLNDALLLAYSNPDLSNQKHPFGLHPFFAKSIGTDIHKMILTRTSGDLGFLIPTSENTDTLYALTLATEELARNASERPGVTRILITLTEFEGSYTMTVTDNGPPLDPKSLKRTLDNVNCNDPRTDNHHKSEEHSGFGLGVRWTRSIFKSRLGDLLYTDYMRRLMATARFTKNGILNPVEVSVMLNPEHAAGILS